ncbi:DUF3459 domain-containing protein [Pontibacter sp. 172403-2]|uniref:alpha-amylase family glycosyl hydrolase n=1 Tax=Pontibacter rufus TaxID=2791028 RepID=UPI0018AFDBC8|nr:alpha-amylase family glycosyl hydrolase [Pontibacter sp. 172403-2]MBF9254040.1 DUF3459 domain-containing protein [Pontibacter sp. 172403-2]
MQKELEEYRWWQKGIIYQVYPRSFKDASGDGTGDLQGIMQKLDYLAWLGVDAVWVSPIYPSPMDDFGYDITDYTGIEPLFGSMQDFDELLHLIHQKGMKLILDLVPNHTSYLHPWFKESRSSRDNPRRDWYIWRDPAPDGGPPNNWQSVFGGSGWEWDEETGQYYYHAFLKEQPDLNWRNPDVKKAMFDVMRFWLEKGVDGFRVDVIWHLMKDHLFRDNPPNPDYIEGEPDIKRYLNAYSEDQPGVHDIIAGMRKVMDPYGERLLIGEIYLPIGRLVTYYGKEGAGVHLPFNFQLIQVAWDAESIYALVNEYEGSLLPGNWPNWVLGNHDKDRVLSRIGEQQARLAAVLLLTLRGTPTMYYGDEIGMHDVHIPPERIQDPKELTMPGYSRDPQRTPMQWSNAAYAGFSETEPWLPLADDYQARNVETEKEAAGSMLSLYKRLIEVRKQEPALQVGDFIPLGLQGQLMVFKRIHNGAGVLVAINFGKEKAVYQSETKLQGEILISVSGKPEGRLVADSISIEGEDAVVVRLD